MQNRETPRLSPPSLPTGGGTIAGPKGEMRSAGPDGAARFAFPLPISAGRGYAPALTLSYDSHAGNGPFGIGWNINLPSVRRRTRAGAPTYQDTDEFVGPEGEVLVRKLDASGKPELDRRNTLLGTALGASFNVSVWRPRIEQDFSRLEYWAPAQQANNTTDFWVFYLPDGQIYLLGRNPQARLSNPQDPSQTAVWLLESSVSATGEQIYYQYRAEDDVNCSSTEIAVHPHATAARYLGAIYYGNLQASRTLPGLCETPVTTGWLFILVLDYGERNPLETLSPPSWQASGNWRCRRDCFSSYEYGFEVRTRRRCSQILMFHRLDTLAGTAHGDDTPTLITCSSILYDALWYASVSLLSTIQQRAYEPAHAAKSLNRPFNLPTTLPALSFDWQVYTLPDFSLGEIPAWHLREDLGELNPRQPWQLIDLNGEGLAGVLHRDRGVWRYRAPIRQETPVGELGGDRDIAPSNAMTWAPAAPLPSIPTLQNGGTLIDLNSDGRLEWVVTAAGAAGYYGQSSDQAWLHFTPLSALPIEYRHPRAQLADILGAGFADMVLIGPRSVRLYAGRRSEGWGPGQTVIQSDDILLPVPGADPSALVAFSDLAGSGQQHLVQVQYNRVRYWPNLGHGRFGSPIEVPGFTQPQDTFNPDCVFLADMDGSGTTDLIYAQADCLQIYMNQSGNTFRDPFNIPLPPGVRYDATCTLQVADIQGLGVASLLLCVPHPVARYWVLHLFKDKPWLLSGINNSMGTHHTLRYRSSAQFWLDEKQAHAEAAPPCYLPFALHMLYRQQVEDEITGNRLVSEFRYRHGAWDGQEREFRGFGCVETTDTHLTASQATGDRLTLPALSRAWFATGLSEVDARLPQEYWQADTAAFPGFSPRFTQGDGKDETAFTPDDRTAFWLHRALKGLPLRSELYGVAANGQINIVPYQVTENRLQVRLVQSEQVPSQQTSSQPPSVQATQTLYPTYPVVWPTLVENRNYHYEQVCNDPQCSQDTLLSSDAYGHPLQQVSIQYPRRPKPAQSPYPNTLPDTLFASSYDAQQQVLRLTCEQNSWHPLTDITNGIWLLGLSDGTRTDTWVDDDTKVPPGGLTLEQLQSADSLLNDPSTRVFVGQQQVWYLDSQQRPTQQIPAFPPRVAFIEAAVFDDAIIAQLTDGSISTKQLQNAGYQRAPYLFARSGETQLWVARQGYTGYATAEHFWLPTSFQQTVLTGAVTVQRDRHDCVVTQYEDAAGLTTQAQYDYRFLAPVILTDANDNVHTVMLDALGRVIASRFRGTENGQPTGYSDTMLVLPKTVDQALALKPPLPVAQCQIYVLDRWPELPPHILTLSTDRYDNDPAQQIRQQVTFSDGFGRLLQTSIRQVAGLAWQRTPDGALVTTSDGVPQTAETDFRWAVSGRTEYDNKGQAIRTYQPYFLNDWRYVRDDSARIDLYADTHFYDPLGREYQVETAKGWFRRTLFTPWFEVYEDENDTLAQKTGDQ